MYKFTFVILHYLAYDDTIECIESILKNISYNNFNIVVVDNGSENNSGERIMLKYHNQSNLKTIINSENLGFAKGNNIGFKYAKHELKSDFIALINNDTIIQQAEFIDLIIDKYKSYPFHILGPDIISVSDNSHQNPRVETLSDIDSVNMFIRHYRFFLLLNYLRLDKTIEKLKKIFLPDSRLPSSENKNLNPENKEMINVKLHGSCLVFSRDYIKRYNGLYPKTFLYSEESILNYIVKRDRLFTIYFPDARILHKEDVATNYHIKKGYLKRRFYYKNFINSGRIFIELMENDKKKGNE